MKKRFLELCLNHRYTRISMVLTWFSSNFSIFFRLSPQIWTKQWFSAFSKKTNKQNKTNSIFSKIWYQKWILWLISIPKMYRPNLYTCIYITVIVWKLLTALDIFKKRYIFKKKKKNWVCEDLIKFVKSKMSLRKLNWTCKNLIEYA